MDARRTAGTAVALVLVTGCTPPPDPQTKLVIRGERIFFEETFGGNGRTCGTCHRAENNFTIDPMFISTLPWNDPLFVAEFNPNLRDLERPDLLRRFGLILENQDGFDDLDTNFNLRGVPHVIALRNSVDGNDGPLTGWGGDGAPGDGTLRSFATGAVIQHFTRSLDRIPGVDFRLPTPEELDALEAFQLSLGRQNDFELPLPLKGVVPARGQELFMDDEVGKCNICHFNAGATAMLDGRNLGNANFDTGVEDLPDQPARLTGQFVPLDDGRGIPGDGTFNTPTLVEAADTPPFFHNNSVETIEGAVGFYDGDSFNNSPAGQFLAARDPDGEGIELDATQISAIAAFLRVINALESIRESTARLDASMLPSSHRARSPGDLIDIAIAEIDDAIAVLRGGGLHPEAIAILEESRDLAERASSSLFGRTTLTKRAINELRRARAELAGPF